MKMIGLRERFGSHLGLERIGLVCDALGNPQRDLKCIHVAGTSGKGSVAALLSAVLRRSGLRVGLFTSPHLEHYCERFQIDGQCIDLAALETVITKAEAACRQVEQAYPELGAVTEFELATAAGFLYFHLNQVDLVVLETGLGGRLDATNVVDPLLTVITTISLDHQDYLGSTLEEIAAEKAGIVKAGVPLVSGVQSMAAEAVLKQIAQERGAPWRSMRDVSWEGHGWGLSGGQLTFPPIGTVQVGLLGQHQLQNAATALLALLELRKLGYHLPQQSILQGCQEVIWPGRLEVVSSRPFMILDGAHNQEGIDALAQSLRHVLLELEKSKFTFLFGMLHNKELSLLEPLLPLAKRFVFSAADASRLPGMEPGIMVDYVHGRGGEAVGYPSLPHAFADVQADDPVCVCGSLYLVGSVKRFLRRNG